MECFNRCFIFDKSNRVETIFLKKKKKKESYISERSISSEKNGKFLVQIVTNSWWNIDAQPRDKLKQRIDVSRIDIRGP